MDKLKLQFAEVATPYSKKIKDFVINNKDQEIDQVNLGQLFGGLRDVVGFFTETSLLDNNDGIKFRGYTIPDLYKNMPKSSLESKELQYLYNRCFDLGFVGYCDFIFCLLAEYYCES